MALGGVGAVRGRVCAGRGGGAARGRGILRVVRDVRVAMGRMVVALLILTLAACAAPPRPELACPPAHVQRAPGPPPPQTDGWQ